MGKFQVLEFGPKVHLYNIGICLYGGQHENIQPELTIPSQFCHL